MHVLKCVRNGPSMCMCPESKQLERFPFQQLWQRALQAVTAAMLWQRLAEELRLPACAKSYICFSQLKFAWSEVPESSGAVWCKVFIFGQHDLSFIFQNMVANVACLGRLGVIHNCCQEMQVSDSSSGAELIFLLPDTYPCAPCPPFEQCFWQPCGRYACLFCS